MSVSPEPRERRATPLYMMPVCAVDHCDGAAVDEAHVATRDVGHSNATLCDLVFGRRQQNGEATLMGHSRHADHDAQRWCRQRVGAWRSARPVLTKYGQPAHNALPVGTRSDRWTIREEWVRDAVVPQVARAQVVAAAGGITNAPRTISRLRV